MVRKLAFNRNAQAPELKEHVWTVFAMKMDRLRVGSDAEFRDHEGQLCINCLFAVPACRRWRIHADVSAKLGVHGGTLSLVAGFGKYNIAKQ
jgi:hypothetical protein